MTGMAVIYGLWTVPSDVSFWGKDGDDVDERAGLLLVACVTH